MVLRYRGTPLRNSDVLSVAPERSNKKKALEGLPGMSVDALRHGPSPISTCLYEFPLQKNAGLESDVNY
jgi:hypothetical protein